MEERPEEAGCSDICPPRVLIYFKCRKSSCVSDPFVESSYFETGAIEFSNIKRGKKAFEFLKAFKRFVLDDLKSQ